LDAAPAPLVLWGAAVVTELSEADFRWDRRFVVRLVLNNKNSVVQKKKDNVYFILTMKCKA